MNINEPLGMPKGSVRAIIGLAFTTAAIVALFLGKVIPGEFFGFIGAIIGFYFGSRAYEQNQ